MKKINFIFVFILGLVCSCLLVACNNPNDLSQTPNGGHEHDMDHGVCLTCAYSEGTDGLDYELSEDESYYIVTGIGEAYNEENVVIPTEHEGLPVREISKIISGAVKTIAIPKSVDTLGPYALESCPKLEIVVVTDSIKEVELNLLYQSENAQLNNYENCGYLGNKNQPYLVAVRVLDKTVNEVAFHEQTVAITARILDSCDSVTAITVPQKVSLLPDLCFYGTKLKEVALHSGIKSIGRLAFNECYDLKSVTGTEGLVDIGEGAFQHCFALEEFELCEGLVNIGDYAFKKCESLPGVTLPDSLLGLGNNAFYMCLSITEVNVGSGLKEIKYGTFALCGRLQNVRLNSVVSIESLAFEDCSKISALIIPETVTDISGDAFAYLKADVFCEATTAPAGWNVGWNISNGKPLNVYFAGEWSLVDGEPTPNA